MELRETVLDILEKCAEWQELRSEIGMPRVQGARSHARSSFCGF